MNVLDELHNCAHNLI